MMNAFMFLAGPATLAAIVVSIYFGYLVVDIDTLGRHVLVGLLACLVGIFIMVVVMFYFIATGAIIKNAVKDGLVDVEKYYTTRKFKGRLFPWISVTIVLLMALPILGAASDAGKLPSWIHAIIAWGVVLSYVVALLKTKTLMAKNRPIFVETILAIEAAKKEKEAVINEEKTE